MGATGGEVQTVWDNFFDCWESDADSNGDGIPDTVVNMTLPVIDCPGNNVGNCAELVGAVNVNLVWMIRTAFANKFDWVPLEMTVPAGPDGGTATTWSCGELATTAKEDLSDEQFLNCFVDFVDEFDLVNYSNTPISSLMDPLSQLNNTMFFLPDCDAHIPVGGTGGRNFSVLAKIPVLVQ
jgi:hypothetical protein